MKLGLEELGVTGVDQLGGRTTWWYRLHMRKDVV